MIPHCNVMMEFETHSHIHDNRTSALSGMHVRIMPRLAKKKEVGSKHFSGVDQIDRRRSKT